MVKSFGLHLDERVVATMHVEPLGHVIVEVGDTAFRVGRGHDPQRPAIGKVPHVLFRLDRAVRFVKLLSPLAEILLLRQLAPAAQGVEHGRIGRRLIEEAVIEFEERAEGGVIESELAVDIENGDAGCQLIEHAAVRLDHARQFRAHGLDLGAIDRDAGAAGRARRVNDLENAPAAGSDSRQPADIGLAGGACPGQFRSRWLVEQFQSAGHRFSWVAGFHRAGISGIHEDQFAGVVARPYGCGQ